MGTENDIPKITKCLNCGIEFEGNFCPNCGQKADTGRFTMRFIRENLIAAFLGRDGSIWFTLKSLFTRPGEMIVDNLNGKRKKYFSPFPMLFLALTLYLLLTTLMNASVLDLVLDDLPTELPANATKHERNKYEIDRFLDNSLRFYYGHYTLCTVLTLPLAVMATRTCFGKKNRKRYYRAEYVIPIVYASVIVILFRCLTKLLHPLNPDLFSGIGIFFSPLITIIAYTACFRKMLEFSVAKTLWRSVLSQLFYTLLMGVLLLAIIIGFAIYIVFKYK